MGVHGGIARARYFGLKGNGTDEDMTKVNKLINYISNNTNKERIVEWGPGVFRIPSTVQINTRGIRFWGEMRRDSDAVGGTKLEFNGTGPLIQLGTDSGNPYDTNEYDGVQSFELRDIYCQCIKTDGTLANAQGKYGVGTQGLVDWRGGDLVLTRSRFARFETGMFLVQSDINVWDHMLITQNQLGVYLGPRSDQQRIHDFYSFHNEQSIHIDGARSVSFFGGEWVDDGTTTKSGIKINNTLSIGAQGINWYGSWFERLSTLGGLIPAFLDVSIADTVASDGVGLHNPFVIAIPARQRYIMRVGNATGVELDYPAGGSHVQGNFTRWVQALGSSSPDILIRASKGRAEGNILWENGGTGRPLIVVQGPRGFGLNPSFSAGAGLGAGPSGISMGGNNEVGILNFTTGTSPRANSTLGTVTFQQAYSEAPRHVEIVAQNAAAAEKASTIYIPRAQITATGFQINIGSNALAASTSYNFSYRVVR